MLRAALLVLGLLVGLACSGGTNNTCDTPTRPSEYDVDAPLPSSCDADAGDAGVCEPVCQIVCPQPSVSLTYLGSCLVTGADGGDAGARVVSCHYLPYPIDPVCR